ncbi:uncharacterized protein LOC125226633 [Leguminivora glycinivorella]|uniref:uncharacterized protein LOC125226633 n=1 Tax=Leguminivora glycinivorella TaxID=1035111 RepID=UPI00200D1AC1|nr:uncharacterized protein LOC125226633 [Leguminivora glycinivorella]
MSTDDNDSDLEMSETLAEIRDAAATVTNNLPQKSRKQYEKTYKYFMDWLATKNTKSLTENTLVLYFEHLSTKFKPVSLWTFYSMLKITINMKHKVDISKYDKLLSLLKRKCEGYKGKKSMTFLPEEIEKFLNEAPDKQYLIEKVTLIFGIMGACRRQEFYKLQQDDVKLFDSALFVTVRNRNKTGRTFTVTGSYFDVCKKYIDLRPKPCELPDFFLQYVGGKCIKQKVGLNKLGSLGKTIATYLQLPNPELYTGHCFRRTSAKLQTTDMTTLIDHGGLNSTIVAEDNIDDSVQSRVEISNETLNSIRKKEVINITMPTSSANLNEKSGLAEIVQFSHCTIQSLCIISQ